jgi:hypothetical protein
VNWKSILTPFDKSILDFLGVDHHWGLPSDRNPIVDALRAPITRSTGGDQMSFEMLSETKSFVEWIRDIPGFNKQSLSRLATICQMAFQDSAGGPDGDRKRKGLRRQWYAWFKTRFAQPFSNQLAAVGDKHECKGFDGTGWSGRQSVVFGKLVDVDRCTYWDLWVEDTSRMMESYYEQLYNGLHLVIAVEKDSLLGDFTDLAKAIGARVAMSGKGKNSKGATEKMLRDHFGWSPTRDPFSHVCPLIILSITDLDMDGESVIAPTFAEQARRYTHHVLEVRVGISVAQVKAHILENDRYADVDSEMRDLWYEGKINNQRYIDWSDENALFEFECIECGHRFIAVGSEGYCESCGAVTALRIMFPGTKKVENQPMTFEVEALPTRSYYKETVRALLQVIPLDYIIARLRDECQASPYQAAGRIREKIQEENEDYQRLLKRLDEIQEKLDAFGQEIDEFLTEEGEPHREDWRDLEDDPKQEAFEEHVVQRAWGPWRPFDHSLRTQKLTEYLEESCAQEIEEFKDRKIE